MIGIYLDEGHSTFDSIKYTLERLNGTWGLLVMDTQDPKHLYVASNGANMYLGFSN